MSSVTNQVLADEAVRTAWRWAQRSLAHPEPRATKLLTSTLDHPGGLRFTLEFVDGVLHPENPAVAAESLERLAQQPTPFLPSHLRAGFGLGVIPASRAMLPAVRRVFSLLLDDLMVDIGGDPGPTLTRLRKSGASLNINLLGETVLGGEHASSRLNRTIELLNQSGVDYVSIKMSSVMGPHSPWAHDVTVKGAVVRLEPLMDAVNRSSKLVNLNMEEYRDLRPALEVLERFAMKLSKLRMGLTIQAYLHKLPLMIEHTQKLARHRYGAGGIPLRMRLVKGANLAMERTRAELRGWPSSVLPSKVEADTSYLSALDRPLTPESIRTLHVGSASHNIYNLAIAVKLAKARSITSGFDIEMLTGMAVPLQRVIPDETSPLRLYVPVVPRSKFDPAITYLVRRLEENAAPKNSMSGAAPLGRDIAFLGKEEGRYRDVIALVSSPTPTAWAIQERSEPTSVFTNASDTDSALLSN